MKRMISKQAKPDYLAYLVRLWREGEGGWRGTLENPHTGDRMVFADVASLLAYVQQQTEAPVSKNADEWLDEWKE